MAWHGERDVRVKSIPDPQIQKPTHAIVRVMEISLTQDALRARLTITDCGIGIAARMSSMRSSSLSVARTTHQLSTSRDLDWG